MSDLIDRRQAIDALDEYFGRIAKLKRRGLNKGEKAISLDVVGAIKTLPSAQPEPCEDAVSRNLVLTEVKSGMIRTIDGENWKRVGDNVRDIKAMPSVTPKQRTGKWIEDKGQQTLMQNFIERGEVWRVCSVCGAGHMIGYKYAIDKAYHDRHHNFCPNCGADMRG